MKKIFIDTDIFLDTILDRKPHSEYSTRLINLCEQNEIAGHTSSLVIANIYYILNEIAGYKKAIQAISKIRSLVAILPFTDKEIGKSINAEFKDFEDGIQYFVAVNHKIDCLITRNTKDFQKVNISVLTAKEFLQTLKI
ncbi:MAG: PIN domain-containing protein [Candidatus Aminicenantes bacterium]|nr:PIN domain-containing protein [Candidatus Aminicenantes bacterium]